MKPPATQPPPRSAAAAIQPPNTAFRDMLAQLTPEQRARVDAMKPKDRAKIWVEWLKNDSPEEAASKILTFHDGEPVGAEQDAYALFDLVAGGYANERTNAEGGKYALEVINAMDKGREEPPVERKAPRRIPFA